VNARTLWRFLTRPRESGPVSIRLNSWLPVILLALVLFAHLTTPAHVWLYLTIALAAIILFSYYWAAQLRNYVTVRRQMVEPWLQVGDPVQERFTLDNQSRVPILWAEIMDGSDLPGYSASVVQAVDGGQQKIWVTAGECIRRGIFTLGPWEMILEDPLGLFTVRFTFPETRTLLVYPAVVNLPAIQLPAESRLARHRPSLYPATDAAGIRDYQPGDALRQIHWRTTARRGELTARTFDIERSGDLWIILDLDRDIQAGSGEESTTEYQTILAASLAAEMIRQNRAVGLAAYGEDRHFLMPARRQDHLWRILRLLAGVEAAGHWPLGQALNELGRNMRQGVSLAIITPRSDANWIGDLLHLTRRGISTTVILLDSISFGAGRGQSGLIETLNRSEISVSVIPKGYPFRRRERRVRHRIEYRQLATGRVIPVEVEEEF